MKQVLSLVLLAWLALPAAAWAKRTPAPVVEPVIRHAVRYTVPNDKGTRGYVVATDITTGKELWRKTIFRKCICPFLEHDVQWVFLRQMRLDGSRLVLVDERDRTYLLDLNTRSVKRIKKGKAVPPSSSGAVRSANPPRPAPAPPPGMTLIRYCLEPFRTFEIVGTEVHGVERPDDLTRVLRHHRQHHPEARYELLSEVKSTPEYVALIVKAISAAGITLEHHWQPWSAPSLGVGGSLGPYGLGYRDQFSHGSQGDRPVRK